MSSKAITEAPPDGSRPDNWKPGPEMAPSPVRDDEFNVVRLIGLLSAGLVIFGGLVLVLERAWGVTNRFVGPGWASVLLTLGLVGLLFHAAFDREYLYRRSYLLFGFAALVLGAFLSILPHPEVGSLFGTGFLFMAMALLFIIAPLRNEDEERTRTLVQLALAGSAGLMMVLGLFYSNLNRAFLLPNGLLLALLGLFYATATVASRGTGNELGYRLALAIGIIGAVVFLVALLRSVIRSHDYLFPYGLLLMTLGLAYVLVALALASDNRLVVMTRRELGAFFYSPMAYFVLIGFTIAHWLSYDFAVSSLLMASADPRQRGVDEPILRDFVLMLGPVISVIFVVPALTMRLLSEERRSGTLEVLMTAPVDETVVVLSKFLATLIMYLVMWLPFGLFLLALRIGGGQDFDYRPLLSFSIALLITGAAFISMGVFFSALTRNQVVSGVLTFSGMLALTLVILFKFVLGQSSRDPMDPGTGSSVWSVVLDHISYIDLWNNSINGKLQMRFLLFPISMTIYFLFLSVKVLEGRKWS
jgi:ABC-type transport system involved in multi-copper enzyme maturation permease subunit